MYIRIHVCMYLSVCVCTNLPDNIDIYEGEPKVKN